MGPAEVRVMSPGRHEDSQCWNRWAATPFTERSHTMGDKGGKKDKNKSQKQKMSKQQQEAQQKQQKQQKSAL